MRFCERQGRWALHAPVLGSAVVMLDGTVVNVALPSMGRELGAGVDGLRWTVSGYLLTLSSLILLGGHWATRFGRRLFVLGVIWFAAASLLCGVAPNLELLITARVLQESAEHCSRRAAWPSCRRLPPRAIGPRRSAPGRAWGRRRPSDPLPGRLAGSSAFAGECICLLDLPLAIAVVLVAHRHVPGPAGPRQREGDRLPGADPGDRRPGRHDLRFDRGAYGRYRLAADLWAAADRRVAAPGVDLSLTEGRSRITDAAVIPSSRASSAGAQS